MDDNSKQTVLIYRDTLLPPSETFIQSQADSLDGYRARYLCLQRVSGLNIPESQVINLCQRGAIGRAQRLRFKLFGPTQSQTRTIDVEHPVLVHAHFAPNGCHVITLAQELKVPLIVSLHGYGVNSSDQHLPALYIRRRSLLKSSASRFLCISEFIRTQAIAKDFPAEKCVVQYTGVDTRLFSPDPGIARSPIVLFVGRLVHAKGCEYLVRAMAAVQLALPGTRLVVIGDGLERRRLEEDAKANLTDCEFIGSQPPAVVREWMSRARVFCCPSIVTDTASEGFGMTFVEAQSMGLPVVGTAIGGIPEAVEEGKTGFLVPERNAEAIASKILLLLQNRDLWTNFSESGRARTCERFDLRRQAGRLEQIYDDVVAEWAADNPGRIACTPSAVEL